MTLQRDDVLAALRAEDVASHLGIKGSWRGRWMRSSRCGEADHATDAFGISRDGKWSCHACDKGGDLLKLLALSAGLSTSSDFGKVLELAASIAGVDDPDEFGAVVKPPPVARPPLVPVAPIAERIALAKRRARWVADRLYLEEDNPRLVEGYLRQRGLTPSVICASERLYTTPMRIPKPDDAKPELMTLWRTMRPLALVIPVRAVADDKFVDLRARRIEPAEGQPKIIGMLGGVTSAAAEGGRPRALVGCYGHPKDITSDLVVVVEGALDYLTALEVWPNAQVLGAVEAGTTGLVAEHAARGLARLGDKTRIIIVEQNDPPRTLRDGTVVAGAADAAVNEDPNSALKVAIRHMGPYRVGHMRCADGGVKDLNDLWCARAYKPQELVSWAGNPSTAQQHE